VTSERQSLLARVCAEPDNDEPRLIYADWLEEFGDGVGDAARAEFIRVQCEIEQLEEWSSRRLDLEERSADLFDEHHYSWHEELPDWARGSGGLERGQYRRGFVGRVSATPEQFVGGARELFTAAPVREVRFGWVTDGGRALARCPELAGLRQVDLLLRDTPVDLPDLLASPYLTGLAGLALSHYRPHPRADIMEAAPMLGDNEARALAACPRLSHLTALNLKINEIGPTGFGALVESPYLTRMEQLNLKVNPLGDEGLERLARSPWCRQLTHLDLFYTGISDAGLRTLAAGGPARLRSLKLGEYEHRIGADGLAALGQSEHLNGLRELDLAGRWLDPPAIRALAHSPSLAWLRCLDLSSTDFDNEMAKELAGSPYLRGLRFLNLQNDRLGADGAAAFARSPVLASVVRLYLYNNPIGDRGFAALASSEHLGQLRELSAAGTGIGPAGTQAIASTPCLPQLQSLDLQSNELGDEGGKALCESPHLGRLRSLYLYDCGIGEAVTKALRERFGNALRI
jgi:uncharacterized protein (TIGR02996 family)